MGTLYLIDAHNPVLADSEINDTIPLEAGNSQLINGSFVVNVPFGTPVDGNPTDLTDLITKKYTGLLAYYPGFTYIDYEDGLDATGWDTSFAVSQGFSVGERMMTSLYGGGLQSNPVALTGAAPSEAIFTWEVFELTRTNPKDGVLNREYTESDASDISVIVSFNNGVNWYAVTDGVLLSIPPVGQGTTFLVSVTITTPGTRRWLASWAVLY
jgi:hypothetical protein